MPQGTPGVSSASNAQPSTFLHMRRETKFLVFKYSFLPYMHPFKDGPCLKAAEVIPAHMDGLGWYCRGAQSHPKSTLRAGDKARGTLRRSPHSTSEGCQVSKASQIAALWYLCPKLWNTGFILGFFFFFTAHHRAALPLLHKELE